MKTSDKGINLIKSYEDLRLKAYIDAVGIPTIGYGHTKGVKTGDVITESKAVEFLLFDLSTAENEVNSKNLNINQNQFDALVSFTFNVGAGNFRSSTLLKKAKANPDDPSIAGEFSKWKNGRINGKLVTLPGLVRRRQAESDLYFGKK